MILTAYCLRSCRFSAWTTFPNVPCPSCFLIVSARPMGVSGFRIR